MKQPSFFSPAMPPPSPEDLAAGDEEREAKLTAALDKSRREHTLQRYASLERPVRVGLVGCAKMKRSEPTPARSFYASPLFRAALAYAELVTDEAYILSAFHGLVSPDQVLAPYDHALQELGRKARLAWGDRVVDAIAAKLPRLRVHLVILSGRDYAIPVHVYAVARGWTVEGPLSGLSVGERLSWLKRETALRAPAVKKRGKRAARLS